MVQGSRRGQFHCSSRSLHIDERRFLPNTGGCQEFLGTFHRRVYLACCFADLGRHFRHCRSDLFPVKLAAHVPRKSSDCPSQTLSDFCRCVCFGFNVCSRHSGAAGHPVRAVFRGANVGYESSEIIQIARLLLANNCRRPFGCAGLLNKSGGDRGGGGNGQNRK